MNKLKLPVPTKPKGYFYFGAKANKEEEKKPHNPITDFRLGLAMVRNVGCLPGNL